MFYLLLWIVSVVATLLIAREKRLNAATYCVLSFFLGPIGLLIALIEPARSAQESPSGKIKSLEDAQQQLDSIRTSLSSLQRRVTNLAQKINQLSGKGEVAQELPSGKTERAAKQEEIPVRTSAYEVYADKEAISYDYEKVTSVLEGQKAKKQGFEFTFGKYWLNRIGVVIFVLGVTFFISYTFRYLTAWAKILIGYLASVGFFVWGNILEKNKKYIRLAWGILGGAWALLYLSTYALYYIEATRVISNPVLELSFLATVSFAAVFYNLKYRSWIVTAITSLLAFITVGIGGIEYSTLAYCALLIGTIAYLAYRLKWYKFLLFGICGVYITYMYWLYPRIFTAQLTTRTFTVPVYQFHLSFGILAVSWIVFSLPLLILSVEVRQRLRYIVSGTLLNAGFFIFLGLAELYRFKSHLQIDWDVRFWFLIILAAIYFLFSWLYKILKKPKLTVSSIGIAASLVAAAIMVKFPRLDVGFFWISEMMVLFVMGFITKNLFIEY